MLRLVLLLACLVPAALHAQTLRVEGDLNHPSARLLREIAERGRYLVVHRDTVLPPSFRAEGDLVVVGAEVRLEGVVDGAVAVLDGSLFVRPRARIAGPVVAIRGEVYRSGLASVGEVIYPPLDADVQVVPDGGEITVALLAPPGPSRLRFPGMFGLGLPSYDRVDGLTLRWGSAIAFGRDSTAPSLAGTVSYHSARGAVGGAISLGVPLGSNARAIVAAIRATLTNEHWIRGPLVNSAAAIVLRSDSRDYHLSDRVSLTVRRQLRQPLIAGEARMIPYLTVQASRDRSVEASDPWALFGDEPWRPNPPIDEGTLASVVAGSGAEWKGRSVTFAGDLALEWAPPGIGDFSFAQAVATGTWEMQALWGHSISVFTHARQTVGSDPAPRQRWSFVGGSGTLPTEEIAARRGDRVLFVSSAYSVPLPWPVLPVLGPPALRLETAVGSAWVTGADRPRWEQNLGVGLDFGLARAALLLNPADGLTRPTFNLSAGLPF